MDKSHFFLLFIIISLCNCLTVSETGKKVLSKEIIKSERFTRTAEQYNIHYFFQEGRVVLSIDGGILEEDVDKVLEKETVKKIYKVKFSELYKRGVAGGYGYGYLAPGYYIGAIFEYLFTIPFRTYSPSYDETFNRENIINQRKIRDLNFSGLSIILRIDNIEFLNTKLNSVVISFPLLQLYRDFGIANEMEVLLYRGNDRVGFKVVPLTEILRSAYGKREQ